MKLVATIVFLRLEVACGFSVLALWIRLRWNFAYIMKSPFAWWNYEPALPELWSCLLRKFALNMIFFSCQTACVVIPVFGELLTLQDWWVLLHRFLCVFICETFFFCLWWFFVSVFRSDYKLCILFLNQWALQLCFLKVWFTLFKAFLLLSHEACYSLSQNFQFLTFFQLPCSRLCQKAFFFLNSFSFFFFQFVLCLKGPWHKTSYLCPKTLKSLSIV